MIKKKTYKTIKLTSSNLPDQIEQVVNKLNEVINHINNQEEIAASTGNSSRITPNPKKGSVTKLFKLYNLNPNEYIYSRLIEDLELLLEKEQANGETPAMDNPVASLDNLSVEQYELILNCLKTVGDINSYQHIKTKKAKDCYELYDKLKNARTTDKEQPKFTEYEYNLICKGLNLLGITSGRIFYVLNRSVKRVDDTV